ncbi:MAG: GAF domain-containing protein [Chloroflexi bacterium]|nr:GAF domain-containing protein [Chloroflexota bacterium]
MDEFRFNATSGETGRVPAAQVKILYQVSQVLRSEADTAAKLQEVVAAAIQLSGAESGIALLLSKERQHIDVVASTPNSVSLIGYRLAVDSSTVGQWFIERRDSQPAQLWANTQPSLFAALSDQFNTGDMKFLPPNCSAVLGIPLMGQSGSMGGVLLFSIIRAGFSLEETAAQLLEVMATQAATVVEDALLFDAASRMAEQMRLVNEVSLEMVSLHDMDAILSLVPNRLTETFGYYHASVGVVGDNGIEMFEASQHSRAVGLKRFHIQINAKGMVPWVARHGVMHLANDTRQDALWVPGKGLEASRAELTVPLLYRDRTIGVIDVQSEHLNAFDQGDVVVLEALAGQLAVAIENARLFNENTRQRRIAETLSRVSRLVGVLIDIQQVAQTVLQELKKLLPFDTALITLYEGNSFRVVHQAGYDPQDDAGIHWLIFNSPVFHRIVRYQELVLVSDTLNDRLWQKGGPRSARSWLGVPLLSRERAIGVFSIGGFSPDVYNKVDSQILFAFANQIAGTIDNAQLLEKSEQRESEARALYEITRQLVSLDQDLIPASVMQHLGEALRFDAAGMLVSSTRRLVIAARRSVTGQAVEELESHLCETYSGFSHQVVSPCALSRHLMLIGPISEEKTVEQLPTRFSVPLLVGRTIVGIWEVARQSTVPFADSEIRLLYILANLTAVAFENARLYQETMARATNFPSEAQDSGSLNIDRPENSAGDDM